MRKVSAVGLVLFIALAAAYPASAAGSTPLPGTTADGSGQQTTATPKRKAKRHRRKVAAMASTVSVSVTPATVQLGLGQRQQFSATVTGTTNAVVIWSLSGQGCAGVTCGSINGTGLYTAPPVVPNPPDVTVTATSLADLTKSGTALVTLSAPPPVTVTVTPKSAQVAVNVFQQFSATVTGTTNTSVTWNVTGTGCVGYTCGTITASGLYVAPAIIPSPATVTVTATSKADPTKSGAATVTITPPSNANVSISPSAAQLSAGAQQQFSATVTGTSNTSVIWSLAGAGCTASSCGIITSGGLYTAPPSISTLTTVTVIATSVAFPSVFGTATITLLPPISVSISPANVTVHAGAQQQFAATVTGTTNTVVLWSVSGAGCSGTSCGSITATGLYTAPSSVPSPSSVTVIARSVADPTKAASALVTISAGSTVAVTISPTSTQVDANAQQQFTATVTGTTNTAVTWSVSGLGCTGSACGTIGSSGLYTAPSVVPSPAMVTVKATSQADPTKSASAQVTLIAVIGITISPASAQVVTNTKQQFTAIVTGTNNTTVLWSVTGSGCAGPGCGTISQSGLYTAPVAIPNPPVVSVKAIAQADPSKTATGTVTVVPPIVVTVVPSTALVSIGTQQPFSATVTGSSNTSVTWSVSGAGCSGSVCGTVSSSGLYTAPAVVPNPARVSVVATSVANPAKSGAALVTIMPSNNSKLNGQYAFLFRGFDSNGVYESAGSFTADGYGNVLNGVEDINRFSGPATNLSFNGTYNIGGDGRGVLNITNRLGTYVYTFALNVTGKIARVIEFDNSGIRCSGIMKLQTPSAFSNAAVAGGYSVNLSGADFAGGRIGAVGAIFPSGSGTIAGSGLDVNDSGNLMPTFINYSGTYSIGANGRGGATLNIPGLAGGVFNFSVYVVSSKEFFLISTDPITASTFIFAGSALQQAGSPFTLSSLNGYSIFSTTGVASSVPDVVVGRMSFDGKGGVVVQFDENNGGQVAIGGLLTGGYSVQLNGRTVLNLVNTQNHVSSTLLMYLSAQNAGVLLSPSASVSVGPLQAQLALAPFNNAGLQGNFIFAPDASASAGAVFVSGVDDFNGGGNVAGTEDENQKSGLFSNLTVNGIYSVSQVSNNGRGVVILSYPAAQTLALWQVSYSQFFAIDIDPTVIDPTLVIFEQ